MYNVQHNMQRKSVNLNAKLAREISPYFRARSREREALEELLQQELTSESDVLQGLIRLGIWAVRDRLLEDGYAAWAATWTEEDEQWSRAGRELAARRWRDEPD